MASKLADFFWIVWWAYGITTTLGKDSRGLSAGRVQSVEPRLVVEREREIRAFVPVEYWKIHTNNTAAGETLNLKRSKKMGKTLKLGNKAQADEVVLALGSSDFIVSAIEEKPTQSRPSAPFITSRSSKPPVHDLGLVSKKP